MVNRFVAVDVNDFTSVVRHRAFKGMVDTKGGAANKYSEFPCPGTTLLVAMAHQAGMAEFEPTSGSQILIGFCFSTCESLRDFLRLEDFSARAMGCFIFTAGGTARAMIPPFSVSIIVKTYGNGSRACKIKITYNIITLPTVRNARWDWPRDYEGDIRKWPRFPPAGYGKPRITIERKLGGMLHQIWRKQMDAGVPAQHMLVSAETAMRRAQVQDHQERTPAPSPPASPARKGRKPRRSDGKIGKYGGTSNKQSPGDLKVIAALEAGRKRLQAEQKRRVAADKKARADKRRRARQ